MFKNICFFIVCFFCCFNLHAKSEPDWIRYPYKECEKNQICASGSGDTLNLAKADARNNILKYFKTEIKSSFKSSLFSDETEVKALNSDEINESSEGILKATEIKETYFDKSGFYAFAVLNKDVLQKEILADIRSLDLKMEILLSEKKSKYTKQLKDLYKERYELNKQHLFLTGNQVAEKVKYRDIFDNKKYTYNIKYYVNVENNDLKQASSYLKNLISENGFKIVNSEKKADKIINIDTKKEEMYLNVDGFEKEKYTVNLTIYNKNKTEKKEMIEEFIDTGRNKKQIIQSINEQVKKYFDNNIENIL